MDIQTISITDDLQAPGTVTLDVAVNTIYWLTPE
jgi:hypothetical protein